MGLVNIKIDDKIWTAGDEEGFLIYEKANLQRDTYYIVCPYGIGDTLYAASLAESYRRYRSIGKKLCFIVKNGHSQIPDWFDAIDEKIVSDEMVNILNIFSVATGTWELKNYLYGHFRKEKNMAISPEYGQCEVKNMIYRYKKLVFHLPVGCGLEEPKIVPQFDLLEMLTEEYEIGEKTIILMPYANSTNLISNDFWELIVNLLISLGYQVLTNVKDEGEAPVKGTRGICTDIATMAALSERCGLVIALRSGLCDVLAFTEAKLLVLNNSAYHLNEWDLKVVADRKNIYSLLVGGSDIIMSLFEILGYKVRRE